MAVVALTPSASRLASLVAVMLAAALAPAEEAPDAAIQDALGAAGSPSARGAAPFVRPPEVLLLADIPPPGETLPRTAPVQVTVRLQIDVGGEVSGATLLRGAGTPFDEAVLQGVRAFRFRPAALGGEPVAVEVPYTHTFLAPRPAPAVGLVERSFAAALAGRVQERGTRTPVAGATLVVTLAGEEFTTVTDQAGGFRLPLPEGAAEVLVLQPGYRRFLQVERLVARQELRVRYLVDRDAYDAFETVVTGARERTEISRTTLEGREIQRVPGTFGDPFRVFQVLPGVTQAMSLLPLPIVRGSSPGSTGFFLDQVRLPLLFHLLGGPSVVHPAFVDRVDFFPGGFPVTYGGYTGGIVDGLTRRAKAGENRLDLDLTTTQAGAFVRRTFDGLGVGVTGAGRMGYPGLLLSLLTPDISLDYWDYQLRLDGGGGRSAWSVFAYGAKDELRGRVDDAPGAALETVARFGFHRLDLRWRQGGEASRLTARVVVGADDTRAGGEAIGTTAEAVTPQLRWEQALTDTLRFTLAGEVQWRAQRTELPSSTDDVGRVVQEGTLTIGSAWLEGVWKPLPGLLVVPGARVDGYAQKPSSKSSVDPRLLARWHLGETPAGDTWLKGVVGVYHQPPRLPVALPGLDQSALDLGLLQSVQSSVGVEVRLAPGVELDVQAYFNDLDPVFFDLAVNANLADLQTRPPTTFPGQEPGKVPEEGDVLTGLFAPRRGRAYGLELLLRKRDTAGLFGWISYTLSRSERLGDGWQPFDFDRTHILNLVAGLHLPRNWEVGGRLLFQTGTPLTTMYAYNAGRSGPQLRLDVRIDKRAVWNEWLLDFYVDVVNAIVGEESGGLVGGAPIRYVVPTVGFRAVL